MGGGALAVLVALALGAGARAGAAWVWVEGPPADLSPGGSLDSDPSADGAPAPPATHGNRSRAAPVKKITALAAAPPGRVLIDVSDLRSASRPGDPTPVPVPGLQPGLIRLVSLPAGARLPDLLAAASLPADLPVVGVPARGSALPTGLRLVVEKDGPAHFEAMPAVRRLRLGLPLDLNAASADDLARLPGIGPGLAARIVEDRARRGPFPGPAALQRVRGIGPVRLARVRAQVTVDAWPPGMGPAGRQPVGSPGRRGSGDPPPKNSLALTPQTE